MLYIGVAVWPQVEKEKDALRMELNKSKQQLKETDAAITAQKAEIGKLNKIINEADEERLRQKKEYDVAINERDILGVLLFWIVRTLCTTLMPLEKPCQLAVLISRFFLFFSAPPVTLAGSVWAWRCPS